MPREKAKKGEDEKTGEASSRALSKLDSAPKLSDESGGERTREPAPTRDPRDLQTQLDRLDESRIDYVGIKQKKVTKLVGDYNAHMQSGAAPTKKQVEQLRVARGLLEEIMSSDHGKKTRDPKWPDYCATMGSVIVELGVELRIVQSQLRMDDLQSSGELEKGSYHGTSSGLMASLEKGKSSEMHSGQTLVDKGIKRSSGEGDFFSGQKGEKDFISIGVGELGLGTATAYALANDDLANYNTARFTDEALTAELKQLADIIQNFDEKQIKTSAPRDTKDKDQFIGLQKKLQDEQTFRAALSPGHPRRRGEDFSGATWPVVLQIDTSGLDVRDDGNKSERDARGEAYDLPGERMVHQSIDLALTLVRAWAPARKMPEAKERLARIVGRSNFEVLALEALSAMPQGTRVSGALIDTTTSLAEFEAVRKSLLEAYSDGMKHGTPITFQEINSAFAKHK